MKSEQLSEELLDTALTAVVRRVPEVGRRILREVGVDPTVVVGLTDARRSVMDSDGETDVRLEWRTPSGERVTLLIEHKLTASFQPDQGERYRQRAERLRAAGSDRVETVLIAPDRYFRSSSADVRAFDAGIPLEELADWIEAADPAAPEAATLRACLARVEEGGALGAKGLFETLHEAVAAELERRDSSLRLRNHATDWMFFSYPASATGVEMRYRIGAGVAELAFTNYFKGDLAGVLARVSEPLTVSRSGSYTFVRVPPPDISPASRNDRPVHGDAGLIADALEDLVTWWAAARHDVHAAPAE